MQAIQLINEYDIRSLGFLSADYIHLVTEALKLALADRDEYYGDPDFVDVPLDILLSAEYSSIRRWLIDMGSASHRASPGDP